MKKLIQLILLFAVLTVCADAKKLALIGDDKTCSLLTVELSKNDSIQLLERAEIKKALREHKLSNSGLAKSQLAKLFPHVDIFTIIREKRLIVFNAKDGFRLMDSNASKVQELAELIRMAVKKLSIQNPVYVSIVSVRDIGVPRRYKPKIKVFTRMLKQELMKQPNIQMLERSHLALVNKERELTEKRYNLKSSARLLTLEFEPGSEAQIVNVKLLVRNLKNDLLNRIDAPDAFKDISKACKMLSSAVNGKAKVIVQSKAEAEQFYKEFLALRAQASKVYD